MNARLAGRLAWWLAAALCTLTGVILATEMAYQASLGSLADTGEGAASLMLWGWRIDVHAAAPWGLAALCVVVGAGALVAWQRSGRAR
ncbi:hypothetical protein ABTE16_19815, partial [Acinetobacter baumannii]